VVSEENAPQKVIEFNNIKRRGDVCQQAAYRYSAQRNLRYTEQLQSIQPVEEDELFPLHQAEEVRSDAESIDAITQCIQEGINTKMALADAADKRSGVSKRTALQVLDKYCGNDPDQHLWNFKVHKHGAKKYYLLNSIVAGCDPAQ
jgi:hypothetical protein